MSYTLSRKEEQVMKILWQLEKAFVKEIIEELPNPKPPYNTISSIVRKLESEGHIGHEAFGKTHRYFPILKEKQYKKFAFKSLMNDYFKNSHKELLSYFVKEEKLSKSDIAQILDDLKKTDS